MNKYNSKPCKRVIKSDKSEKNDPSNELWWYNTFNELEKEYNIVSYNYFFLDLLS